MKNVKPNILIVPLTAALIIGLTFSGAQSSEPTKVSRMIATSGVVIPELSAEQLLFASLVIRKEIVKFKYTDEDHEQTGFLYSMVAVEGQDAGAGDFMAIYLRLPSSEVNGVDKVYRLRSSSRGDLFSNYRVIGMSGSYLNVEFHKFNGEDYDKFVVGFDITHTNKEDIIYISEE